MKRIHLVILFLSLLCSFVLQSCEQKNNYPIVPTVSFKEFSFQDTVILNNEVKRGTLTFSFTDGDGDIGFDTTQPRQNTIFMTKYKMVDNVITPMDLLVDLNYFVERLYSDNEKKAISGDMLVEDLNEYKMTFGDTIMYKFYIVDRAGNRSNTDSTGLIVIR
ncbi:MAG: hypothetical protein HUK15_03425 [Bacteroidales bacterium]|nr:hypothetical protein [Bacteroidales bacterium]